MVVSRSDYANPLCTLSKSLSTQTKFVSCFFIAKLIFKSLRREHSGHSGLCEQSNNEENQKTGAKLLD